MVSEYIENACPHCGKEIEDIEEQDLLDGEDSECECQTCGGNITITCSTRVLYDILKR